VVTALARAFRTAWFTKAARKARIMDVELWRAFSDTQRGLADDLGGGVFKKRLGSNRYRSILVAKGGRHWIFVFLFAKQDRANISADELDGFRKLANAYATMSGAQIDDLVSNGDLQEIVDGP
jgi:hypothetical protein